MKNLFHESMESISGSIKHYSDQELDKVQSEFQDKLMRYKNIGTLYFYFYFILNLLIYFGNL